MNTYICTTCGDISHSAGGPDALLSDRCDRAGCDGRVQMAEEWVPQMLDEIARAYAAKGRAVAGERP